MAGSRLRPTLNKPATIAVLLSALLVGCSSAKKKQGTVEFADLVGKKVALVSLEGDDSAKKVVEVALINQLAAKGDFILISKQDVEAARSLPNQDPMDLEGIAKSAGADYALSIKVLQFAGDIHEGYDEEEVKDSQLAAEQGTDGETQQVFKVKALEGRVKFDVKFIRLADHHVEEGTAEAHKRLEQNAKSSAIHLPPVLRFLEELSNEAFREFF